ncbi:twin-arginine translocation signal domain-containing protein [Streptomyces lydicus]|uniref:twin-arginine translocation signal domain-containing protein n=1 Tax=Streptomyces lydicus TaxID=47763 RepID=UPI0036FBE9BE
MPGTVGPYTVLGRLDGEAPVLPVPEQRLIGRSADGDRTVLIGVPLPGADPGRFLAEADASRYLLGPWSWPAAELAAPGEPPRGAERAWRRGPVSQAIKERESGIHELTTLVAGAAPQRVSRRRLLTGLAAGGAVLAAGGGAAVAWWPRPPAPPGKKVDLFAFPPAVRTPVAHVLNPDDGDMIVGGSPKELWVVHGLGADTPARCPSGTSSSSAPATAGSPPTTSWTANAVGPPATSHRPAATSPSRTA